ncbi:hypothetical protein EQG49_00270 [Periweissella cryptocerci]|uniref:Uncharacterized protein n=1 Tax=Periweissella cryptocerci TaxID=2506420 RepID=A0A4P6YQV5_9LACO|nr:hypothetical protein [Periweissella cryptocerci]QBO34989.1 hypothetical protein EQG49_00270 [Periweissella cryptocerci]
MEQETVHTNYRSVPKAQFNPSETYSKSVAERNNDMDKVNEEYDEYRELKKDAYRTISTSSADDFTDDFLIDQLSKPLPEFGEDVETDFVEMTDVTDSTKAFGLAGE